MFLKGPQDVKVERELHQKKTTLWLLSNDVDLKYNAQETHQLFKGIEE